jgi:DNA-entry nuclease
MSKNKIIRFIVLVIAALCITLFTQVKGSIPIPGSSEPELSHETVLDTQSSMMDRKQVDYDLSNIPEFTDKPYVELNGNIPNFTKKQLESAKTSFENYSDMDELYRCGPAVASVGKDLMPTEERGSIGMIKPSGWQTVRYDDIIPDKYLYNRCHLIGYQLTGENANEYNLITGTRYLNIEGMLPLENAVEEYVRETNNHVLYRVTPIFKGDDLVASGVVMEAMSVEDNGEGITFCVYAYNEQPGIIIDHKTGDSKAK